MAAEVSATIDQERRRALESDARFRRDPSPAAANEDGFDAALPSRLDPPGQNAARRANEQERRRTQQERAAPVREGLGDLAQGTANTLQTLGTIGEEGGRAGAAVSRGIGAASKAAVPVGRGMVTAGAGMSGSVVGAVGGVPLMIAGGLTMGAGAVGQGAGAAGEAASRAAVSGGRAARTAGGELRGLGRNTSSDAQNIRNSSSSTAGKISDTAWGSGMNRLGAMMGLSKGGEQTQEGSGLVGASLAIGQDLKELLPSITLVGSIVSVVRLHHRLIWGNLLKGQYMPAAPLRQPAVWAGVMLLIDALLGTIFFYFAFIIYAWTNPCAVFTAYLPSFFSFLKDIVQKDCPGILKGSP